jgi:hypothetical protein
MFALHAKSQPQRLAFVMMYGYNNYLTFNNKRELVRWISFLLVN